MADTGKRIKLSVLSRSRTPGHGCSRAAVRGCTGAMPRRAQRLDAADEDGFRLQRGRSRTKSRARSASGARGALKTDGNKTHGLVWECWGTHAGKRCGRMCGGHHRCTRCGRDAPAAAFRDKNILVRDPPNQRRKRAVSRKGGQPEHSAEVARRRKVEEKLRKEKQLLQQQLADKVAEGSGAAEPEEGPDPKHELRSKIAAKRADLAVLEGMVGTTPALAAGVAQGKLEIAALQTQLVEGLPINQRVKNLELLIQRRDKARDKLAVEMLELEAEQVRIAAELEGKHRLYITAHKDIEEAQAARAELLLKKAAEAGATVANAAAPPPAAAPHVVTYETAIAVLQGIFSSGQFSDAEREGVSGVAATRARVYSASAVPVPTSAKEGVELVGDNEAAGLSQELVLAPADLTALEKNTQDLSEDIPASVPAAQPNPPTQAEKGSADGDVAMGSGEQAGSSFDKPPPTAAQAMADIKRRRKQL